MTCFGFAGLVGIGFSSGHSQSAHCHPSSPSALIWSPGLMLRGQQEQAPWNRASIHLPGCSLAIIAVFSFGGRQCPHWSDGRSEKSQ
jgi:hypothetical protein